MDQLKIGTFISKLRKEKQLTQTQLGEILGVSQKTVSRWETGKNMPDISLLKPLSLELGVSISELLEGEKQAQSDGSKEESVNQIIEYTIKLRKNNRVFWNDMNFITTVISVLAVVLLGIGVVIQHLMIPFLILALLLVVLVIRILFCKCPGCGKTLPYCMGKARICPHCGLNFDREEE